MKRRFFHQVVLQTSAWWRTTRFHCGPDPRIGSMNVQNRISALNVGTSLHTRHSRSSSIAEIWSYRFFIVVPTSHQNCLQLMSSILHISAFHLLLIYDYLSRNYLTFQISMFCKCTARNQINFVPVLYYLFLTKIFHLISL